jgi:hypothetical protein
MYLDLPDLSCVACSPDRKCNFIFQGMLNFIAQDTGECDTDDLKERR